jgi:hypothetical protein
VAEPKALCAISLPMAFAGPNEGFSLDRKSTHGLLEGLFIEQKEMELIHKN